MLFPATKIHFTPTLVPTIAALLVLLVTLYLGYWQQGRAHEKQMLQAEFDARGAAPAISLGSSIDMADPVKYRYARATVRGELLASGQIFLDNKFDNERVGFHVITPLKIEGTNRYVLVNRGWVARDTGYPLPPVVGVPTGLVNIEGVIVLPTSRFLELSQHTVQGTVWQNLTVERYRRESGRDVLSLVLLAREGGDALRPVLERPDARAEKHVEYMLTWYSLAATVAILWLALNTRIERTQQQTSRTAKGNER
ncbi:MAG: SURF1 family protein [Burkholderiales bacterium]|nr:SURF1 family protein [Burkholderiales bacterium]